MGFLLSYFWKLALTLILFVVHGSFDSVEFRHLYLSLTMVGCVDTCLHKLNSRWVCYLVPGVFRLCVFLISFSVPLIFIFWFIAGVLCFVFRCNVIVFWLAGLVQFFFLHIFF